jgi:radical SAM superfamily enzyme YgiQ (UPF0313 family)
MSDVCVLISTYNESESIGTLLDRLTDYDVFIVDDNFIGNRRKLKVEILPAMIEWSKKRKHPFCFFTEASINLADDEELMELMAKARFNQVFVGIETPHEESLAECNKIQNKDRDMVASVKKLQNHGLEVQGGFISRFR